MRKPLTIPGLILLFALALSCGGRKAAETPRLREFPVVGVPSMYAEPAERAEYAAGRFWDAFLDTSVLHYSDSAVLNGVPLKEVEGMMPGYVSLLLNLPPGKAVAAVSRFSVLLESFGKKYPDASVYGEMVRLTEKYLYDPNSPYRDEDLYRPFAAALAESPLTPEGRRNGYRHEAELCALNARGSRAADFSFLDVSGRRRTLYGVKAPYVLLIFGNPDCQGCREILTKISGDARLSAMVREGRLKVLDIYIDEDIAAWKAGTSSYPKEWINGYDPSHTIREDRIYHVRALPSLYLLDGDKTVLLKDAPAERILGAL